jgi:hypothetical protein
MAMQHFFASLKPVEWMSILVMHFRHTTLLLVDLFWF